MKFIKYDEKRSTVLYTLLVLMFVCIYIIPYAYAETRNFKSTQMCKMNQSVNDCSFQFNSDDGKSCQVYNTTVCKSNGFTPWKLEPLSKPMKESNSEFSVKILPYALYIDDIHKKNPVSAVNMLLKSINKDISGYSITLTEEFYSRKHGDICRIIDFRNSLNSVDIPFTLFYDCFNKLVEDLLENVTLTFTAYPLNIELSYFVFIPPVPNSTSPCDWKPLVMIFRGSLPNGHIQLKFSNVPNDLNVIFFVVTLLDSSDVEVKSNKIFSNDMNDMIFSEFQSVEGGYYSISVSINLAEQSCTSSAFRSSLFFVGPEIKDYSLVTFIVLMVITIVSASGLVYFSCQWYLKRAAPLVKPTLFLVYFHKCIQHEFLVMYAKFLEKHYGVKVYTLYRRSGNPKAWLEEAYSKSNIIVYVISEGLFQVFDQKNSSFEEEHHWTEQLLEAKAVIDDSSIKRKTFCKICFAYSGKHHVPRCLEHKGPFFMLPDDSEKFLCFIFNCSSKFSLLNKLCCIKFPMVLNSDCLQEDYKKLKEKLKSVIESKSDDVSVLCEKNINKGNILNIWQSQSMSDDSEKINKKMQNIMGKKSDVLSLHKSKNVDKNVFQNECKQHSQADSSDETSNFITVHCSPNECNNENAEVSEREKNFSYLKDEYFRSCVSKMVNFEV